MDILQFILQVDYKLILLLYFNGFLGHNPVFQE